jgi:hypothetical protein
LAVGRYRVGEPVKVAVNPADPADSVLEPGPDLESFIPFGIGLVLVLLGIGEARKGEARAVPAIPEPARPRYATAKVLGVIGAGLLVYGTYVIYQGIGSLAWPSVEGKVVYSRAHTGGAYETLLWYEYHVDGRRHVASNYRNGGNATPFLSVMEEAAKRYPAGRAVQVYYNPGNPEDALLEPGVWYGNFVGPAIGAVVLLAAWVAKRFAEIRASRRG